MRVLLTGHLGYIGSVATRVLLEAGHRVEGLDSGFFRDCTLYAPGDHVRSHLKDIRDVQASDLSGFDAVVHLAGLCNDPLGNVDPDLTLEINHRASVRLAQFAREAGVQRYLYASSCSMYGAGSDDDLLTEAAPLRPLTPYAESKARTEEDVSQLADRDFSPVFLRNATVYGVSPRLRADLVLNNLVGWAHTTGKVRILGDGRAWRPIAHVEDIARACAACLEAPREVIHNRAFNVGRNGENYQVKELADIVRETVPGSVVEFAGESGPDARNYRVDFSRAERELPQFQPTWTARQGAAELYEAMKAHGMDRDMFLGPRFTRLAQIRNLQDCGSLNARLCWERAEVPA